MQYLHGRAASLRPFVAFMSWLGISAVTTRPFAPPTAFRVMARPRHAKTEKPSILEGKCHKCAKWVAVEGVKAVDIKGCPSRFVRDCVACLTSSAIRSRKYFGTTLTNSCR